jgi:FPC/CPF motif-containing protein YcgG
MPSSAGLGRTWNPLAGDPAAAGASSYLGVRDGALAHLLAPQRHASAADCEVHELLRSRVLSEGYPCVGARSALNRRSYRLGIYGQLGTSNAVLGVLHDLYEFSHEYPVIGDDFVTFIAVFRDTPLESELSFENMLWQQLGAMHLADVRHFEWDRQVSSDPADSRFSFSLGGRAYFIVGMHPLASRLARQMPYPMLVFNLHQQFDRLRERGKFDAMKTMIRARDMAFQGSINPMLSTFGETSEVMQYSGRQLQEGWRCPFHPANKE